MAQYDLVVIGGGTAGLVTAAGAAGLGARTALIERDRLGGECLWSGCVPTKALVKAARVAATVKEATGVCLDYGDAVAHMRRVVAAVARHDSPERFTRLGVDVIFGEARFRGPFLVETDRRQVAGKRFVIATGGHSAAPPIPGLREAGCWTHVEALQAEQAPRALAVLGAGPVGLEFAQVFARFGSRVTVLEMADRILVKEDAEIAALVAEMLAGEGITIHTATKVVRVEQAEGRKVVIGQGADGREVRVSADAVLVAAGRAPNLAALGLTEAEARERHGTVKVFRYGFSALDRAIADGEDRGLIKVVCDRRGRILGAHIFGPGAGELIHELALAMQQGVTIGRLSQLIHAYPTRSEGVQRAADLYWRERLFSGTLGRALQRLRAVFG